MRARSPGSRARRRGFTFAEVLAAMLFMAIVLPAAMHGIALAGRASAVAQRTDEAGRLADNLLNEIQIDDLWVDHPASGTFLEPGMESYRWELDRRLWDHDDTVEPLTEVTVRVHFTVQGRERSVALSTLLEEPES